MSIDREINSRVNAYSSNPQALQKKYAMTKELVDLLALQKIKKSMDSARAAVEAQMQTNPATIKQQREQEVFGRTAQDVAQQVGGILQTAKKRQQMAQRRPAPQGLGALMPQQGQRPQQPQTRMMQAGGIVAFDGRSGSRVSGPPKTQEEQIQYLIDQNLTDEQIRAEVKKLGLLPQAADQIIQQVRSKRLSVAPPGPMEEVVVTGQRERAQPVQAIDKPSSKEAEPVSPGAQIDVTNYSQLMGPTETRSTKKDDPSVLSKVMEGLGAIGKGFAERTGESIEEASGIRKRMREALTPESVLEAQRTGTYEYSTAPSAVAEPMSKSPVADSVPSESFGVRRSDGNTQTQQAETKITPQPPVDRGTTPPAPKPFDLQGKLDEVGDAPDPVMVDRTGLEKRGVDFTKAYGVDPASIDPEARGVAALQKAEDYYGVKEKDAELRKGLADLAALDAAQTDPDKLRRDRLKAFLLGGAGRGSSTLAGAGAASVNLGRAQEKDIRSRQIKRNEMLKTIQDQDLKVRELAKGEERAAIERADRIKMDGLRIISNMSNAELSARQTEANAINQSNIANYKGKIERVQLLLEQSNAAIDQAIERAQLASLDASRRGQIATNGIDDAMRRKTEIGKILEQTYRDQLAADPTLMSLNSRLSDPELSDADRQGLLEEVRKRQIQIKANLAVANKAQYDELSELDRKILKLENTRNQILGGGIADIPVSTQEQSLVDQYK